MACGVPCVVTDVSDSATIVGSTGLVVPTGSSGALADAMLELTELLARDEHRLRAEARARIESEFALDVMLNRAERLLEDVSQRRKGGS
jgi:glycosyltransferase involved in cell wall biosynthesis